MNIKESMELALKASKVVIAINIILLVVMWMAVQSPAFGLWEKVLVIIIVVSITFPIYLFEYYRAEGEKVEE